MSAKREVPEAPQTDRFKDQKRKFEFFTHTVDSTDGNTSAVELDVDVNFVGIVQLKDSPVFRAVFLRNSTEFDRAALDYDKRLNELIAEAMTEGVEVQSMDELVAWASGDDAAGNKPSNVIDMTAVLDALKEQQGT